MKLTEKLKGKLENAGSDEEAKKIIAETKKGVEDAGVILEDAELDQAAGGLRPHHAEFDPEVW